MAQAFINRSLRQFVPLRRQLPNNTHRVARVLEENENLFVRSTRRERKAIRPKTTESDSSYGRIVSGRSPRNQTVCTKERSGEETKRRTKRKERRNEESKRTKDRTKRKRRRDERTNETKDRTKRRNEETKETKNENPYTLVSSAANLFTTRPTNRHGKPIRHPRPR